jgi:hypothetical protein
MLNRKIRDVAFKIARHDLAQFLNDHEEELFHIFREELQRLDDDLPEERLFIDIKVVPLGELIMKAVLNGLNRFLTGDLPQNLEEVELAEPSLLAQKEEAGYES